MTVHAKLQPLDPRQLSVSRAWLPLTVLLIVIGGLVVLLESDVVRVVIRAILSGEV